MALTPPPVQKVNKTHKKDFGNPLVQATLLIIILALFSWFILRPKFSKSAEQRNNLKAAEAQLVDIKNDKQDLNKLVEELRTSPDEVAKVDEALPLNGRISKVYVVLDSYVRSSGMTLVLINVDDSKLIAAGDKPLLENPYQARRQLYSTTFTTTVTGTMEQFKNLLQLIETSGRVLDIDSVEVIGGQDATKFLITVKAYSYEKLEEKIIK